MFYFLMAAFAFPYFVSSASFAAESRSFASSRATFFCSQKLFTAAFTSAFAN